MRSLRVFICGMDVLADDLLTELAAVKLPLPDVTTLQPATALDELEATVFPTAPRPRAGRGRGVGRPRPAREFMSLSSPRR